MNTYFNFAESKEKRSRGKLCITHTQMPLAVLILGWSDEDPASQREPQARESTRWMPRCVRPKKDAETGETFKGSCIQAMSLETPNGATRPE